MKKPSKTEGRSDNPNDVKYEHFQRAVDLAEMCTPEDSRKHPKVGVVIIKKGKIIADAYRGQIGRGNHAEYIALERIGRDKPEIDGADLLTTLEPCTVRSHDKRPCVTWIKTRNIRKVWIATLDYNPIIAGRGELELQKDGILIGRFPDDMAMKVIKMNKPHFDEIEKKQPQLSEQDQLHERDVIIGTLREKLSQTSSTTTSLQSIQAQLLAASYSRDGHPSIGDELHKVQVRIESESTKYKEINHSLMLAFSIRRNEPDIWHELGGSLIAAGEYGLAAHSAFVTVSINATIKRSWFLLAHAENELFCDSEKWPFGFEVLKFDTTPNSIRSNAWLIISRIAIADRKPEEAVRALLRALQLGNRTEEAKIRTREIIKEFSPEIFSEIIIHDIAAAFYQIYEIWNSSDEADIAKVIFDKSNYGT